MVRPRAGYAGMDASSQRCPSQKGHWQLDKSQFKSYSHFWHPWAWAHAHPAPGRSQARSVTCICVPQLHQDTKPSSKDEADPVRVQGLLHGCQSLKEKEVGELWGLDDWSPLGLGRDAVRCSVSSLGNGMRVHQPGSLGATDGTRSPVTSKLSFQCRMERRVSVC